MVGNKPLDPSSMDTQSLLGVLQQIPFKPRPVVHPYNWPLALRSVGDYITQAPGWMARIRAVLNPYPKPFRRMFFRSADGTVLSGWLGYHTPEPTDTKRRRRRRGPPERREGILIVPGMFSSKDNWIQKARALAIFNEWGYHVFAMDLRGFGESKRVYNTGGWKEAEDVAAAVETFRKAVPLHKLHIYSESLGASATLIAAAKAAREGRKLIDGGLLAVSPYSDTKKQVEHLSTHKGGLGNEFYMVQWFFIQLLHLGGRNHEDFRAFTKAAAHEYKIDVEELYRLASPKYYLQDINVPTLILHSDDDPVVPVEHAVEMAELLAHQRNPAIWRMPWGSHCLYELLDPEWFWSLLREFFDFYCLLPKRIG